MEWINVKDELPKNDKLRGSIYCLVYNKYHNEICVRPYDQYHKCWNTEDNDDYLTDGIGGQITHWMPLPDNPIE